MGHGHGDPYQIPDYKIYKVENVPLLMKTKRALEAQGLKDPWLRNEVWRYDEKQFGNERSRLRGSFLRGMRYGVGAFVVTMVATKLYDLANPSDHGHGHGDHH